MLSQRRISPTILWDMHSVRGKKTLPSATLSFLSLPSATPNQHASSNYINHKTPNIQNPKKIQILDTPKIYGNHWKISKEIRCNAKASIKSTIVTAAKQLVANKQSQNSTIVNKI